MVQSKSNTRVRLATVAGVEQLYAYNFPIYYLGTDIVTAKNPRLKVVDANNISVSELQTISNFIVNLDSLFRDELMLSNTLSANRYLSPLSDTILCAWQILHILQYTNELCLIVDNVEEIILWEHFCATNSIEALVFADKTSRLTNVKMLGRAIVDIVKVYLLCVINQRKKRKYSRINFVHWLNDRYDTHEQLIENSVYFKQFISSINKFTSVALIGHVPSGHPEFKHIVKSDVNLIQQYISFFDIILSSLMNFKLLRKPKNQILLGTYNFSSIIGFYLHKEFWSGSYVKNILFYRGLRKICKNIDNEATIIYPFENQPWEKGLLLAAQEQKKNLKLLAYQFFPIPKNFLIHQFSVKAKKIGLVPSKILTSDHITNNVFAAQDLHTVELGSVRYSESLAKNLNFSRKNKILCCLFLDRVEAISLATKVVTLSQNLNNEFIINYHPLLPKNVLATINSIVSARKNVTISNKPVAKLLEEVFLLIYNSSSVCFDAALCGIPVLYMPCESVINLDRFNGMGKSVVDNKEAIDFIMNLQHDQSFYENYASSIYLAANEMILPFRVDTMEQIIK